MEITDTDVFLFKLLFIVGALDPRLKLKPLGIDFK
jgi:hypothetical protein